MASGTQIGATDDAGLDQGPCCLQKANFDVMAARALSGELVLKDDDETAAQAMLVAADAVGEVAETEVAAAGYGGGREGGGSREDSNEAAQLAVLEASALLEVVASEMPPIYPVETSISSFHVLSEHAVIMTMLN